VATKETTGQPASEGTAKEPARQAVNLQLMPSDGSDQRLLANVTMVQPTAGVALLDFGFLDPAAMAVLTNMARAGKKVPERVNGRLAARVAVSYKALATLHRQIGSVLQSLSRREKKT
jgi:hypothetical protein